MTTINGRPWHCRIAATALLLTATACATTESNLEAASLDNARNKAALIAGGDSSSLMSAALLAWSFPQGPAARTGVPDNDRLALVERAAALAPADAAIASLAVTLCLDTSGCDALAAAARFRGVDAGNAAGWLADLRTATDQGPDAVDTVLRSMATGTSFNLHFNQLVTYVVDSSARAHVNLTRPSGKVAAPFERLVNAVGIVSAEGIPALQSFALACTDPAHRSTRAEACRAILRATTSADTALIQSLGARLRVQLDAPGDPDRIAAEAWRRTYEWQRDQTSASETSFWNRNARAQTQLRLVASLPREQDVMRAMLEKYGRPVEPPATWKPAGSP